LHSSFQSISILIAGLQLFSVVANPSFWWNAPFDRPSETIKKATQTSHLTADLAAAKEKLPKLYARWGELEAIKATAEKQ